MDFSTLPFENQVEILLSLEPVDILNYCQTNTSVNEICQSSWFWDQKGIREFGIPPSILCQMNPYWRYRFVENVEDNSPFLGPLIRGGLLTSATNLIGFIDPLDAINIAVKDDDIETLKFLEPTIREMMASEDSYYEDEPFFYLLSYAFSEGASKAVAYLASLNPEYLKDTIILDHILDILIKNGKTRGQSLLYPYIDELIKLFPEYLEMIAESQQLYDFYLKNRVQ